MHEASIAQGLLEIAARNCKEAGYGKIESIKVRIGNASGVEPDALRFAFECMRAGTPAAQAFLEIEMKRLAGSCDNCFAEFEAEGAYVLSCPQCGSGAFHITSGHEMDIIEIEVS
jgi:hydrogenase nickel incorporation protein HypA/HybF